MARPSCCAPSGLPAYYAMEAFVVLEGGERLATALVPTASLGEGD